MTCRKDMHDKCLCLKRKHDGCAECIDNAVAKIRNANVDLNELIKTIKEIGEETPALYVRVDNFDGYDTNNTAWRSAIDILRGVCDYCEHDWWHRCDGCMWMNGNGDEDRWRLRRPLNGRVNYD